VFQPLTKICSKNFLKKIRGIEKIFTYLRDEIYKTLNKMLQKKLHITSKSYLFPMWVDVIRGAFCTAC